MAGKKKLPLSCSLIEVPVDFQGGPDELKEKSSSPFDKSEDNGNAAQNGIDQPENGFR